VLLFAALGVIFSRNPVHSIMFLVGAFFQSAVLWLLIEAEFLAIVLVLVYVGAVMVLFLFVVMMLDINIEQTKSSIAKYTPFGLILAGIMIVELIQVIKLRGSGQVLQGFSINPDSYSNTEALGAVLYTKHVYAFEIASVILLLAIVAAITLTMRKRPGLKAQDIAKQVAVDPKDRLKIIKMKSESES
jgi:NADH-quinone oxidoreductase subunit J